MNRRYLQGTLDYYCGIYCVINALSCLYNIELSTARFIFSESILSLAARPNVFTPFSRNLTDHYWVVLYMLERWAVAEPFAPVITQPFDTSLLPQGGGFEPEQLLDFPSLYYEVTPSEPFFGENTGKTGRVAAAVWQTLSGWMDGYIGRTALFRFHRYIKGSVFPVVSHWTTVKKIQGDIIYLHDASGEENSVYQFEKASILGQGNEFVSVRIMPESLVLLEK